MTTRWRQHRTAAARAGGRVGGAMLMATLTFACGVVGPPIPPEDVGLARRVQAQEDRERAEAAGRRPAGTDTQEERETPLPPITPMGPH